MDLYFDATEPGQVHELRIAVGDPGAGVVAWLGAGKPGRFATARDHDARPADA